MGHELRIGTQPHHLETMGRVGCAHAELPREVVRANTVITVTICDGRDNSEQAQGHCGGGPQVPAPAKVRHVLQLPQLRGHGAAESGIKRDMVDVEGFTQDLIQRGTGSGPRSQRGGFGGLCHHQGSLRGDQSRD